MKWYKFKSKYSSLFPDSPINNEIYPGTYTWGNRSYTVEELFNNVKYMYDWEYIGEFKYKPEIIGYRFIYSDYNGIFFTYGEIYKLGVDKDLDSFNAFNKLSGFQGNNEKYFEPVYGVTPKKQEIYYQVKEEYVQYFRNLMKSNMSGTDILTREIEIDSPWYNICVKAEVLDLWCNKMYKLDYLF